MATRINPETGVVEETSPNPIDHIVDDGWTPTENDEGKSERVDPESGEIQESSSNPPDHLLGDGWTPKE